MAGCIISTPTAISGGMEDLFAALAALQGSAGTVAKRQDHRRYAHRKSQHDGPRPHKILPLARQRYRPAKRWADTRAPHCTQQGTAKKLPAKAGPIYPVDSGIGPRGHATRRHGKAGIQARHQQNQTEADHQNRSALRQAFGT